MNFTEEMITKAKTASSVEELMKLAAEEGAELTKEAAEKYFSFLSEDGELSDEALETVAGGKGQPSAKFKAGQKVRFRFSNGVYLTGRIKSCKYSDLQGEWYYVTNPDNGQMCNGESCDGKEWTLPLELSAYQTKVL